MGFADNLNPYIIDPDLHSEVIFYDQNVSVVVDRYPKSVVHFLVLPRSSDLTYQTPFAIIANKTVVDMLNPYVLRAQLFAAMHLKAIKTGSSHNIEFPSDIADWYDYQPFISRIRAGFHAVPSMTNLHIHIISNDLNSPSTKRINHYNSFATIFFIPFPGQPGSDREKTESPSKLLAICHYTPLQCVFCQQHFDQMNALKWHLKEEFDQWKKS